jgi:hypothetical protein
MNDMSVDRGPNLQPCPFCGQAPTETGNNIVGIIIECTCEVGPIVEARNRAISYHQWNRRPLEDAALSLGHNCGFNAATLLQAERIAQLESDLATAREQLARINDALALSLPQIEDWTHAYPKESFPEPDMDNVRRMLGDSLLSVVSADAMRHVITRVWELLEPVRSTAQAIDSGLKP